MTRMNTIHAMETRVAASAASLSSLESRQPHSFSNDKINSNKDVTSKGDHKPGEEERNRSKNQANNDGNEGGTNAATTTTHAALYNQAQDELHPQLLHPKPLFRQSTPSQDSGGGDDYLHPPTSNVGLLFPNGPRALDPLALDPLAKARVSASRASSSKALKANFIKALKPSSKKIPKTNSGLINQVHFHRMNSNAIGAGIAAAMAASMVLRMRSRSMTNSESSYHREITASPFYAVDNSVFLGHGHDR
eukprot:CAMPEP_0175085876 /NCGR_PEP_ID=MMETSP0052_2-20121109/28919_1 /TAXON_ID=51329 ORGANISM="Polytomella parva, Strain SAG 63-3" /NCGR_SAMPLE_ID=MMETSP0052_2 /ASSEMBLY_ACC=CAM_ASM_000194 /LENGTH=248 /DNA_ID=CAMNT_0016357961 /DNA_START=217 /DNA_END=959 /DNA_ORIENTATION=+